MAETNDAKAELVKIREELRNIDVRLGGVIGKLELAERKAAEPTKQPLKPHEKPTLRELRDGPSRDGP